MYIDLNVPVPVVADAAPVQSKKNKGKQAQQPQKEQPAVSFTPAQLAAIEARIDLLVYLGYTVLALNQTVQKKIDPKTHVNVVEPLLARLRKRSGVAFLKRLTIVLDEDSEKGFGLTTGNASLVAPYDLIALLPTTATSFSLACLSHTTPSPLTAHIITLPLTLPRLPFNLKHTLVRTALKNGAVFELPYAGALGAESDAASASAGGESGAGAKRNWWAAAREVVRVTKGKGILVTGGVANQADLRAPRDVGNLITLLGLPQNVAHDALTKTPQSLILRAQTRRTYRAVFSEPTVIIPEVSSSQPAAPPEPTVAAEAETPPPAETGPDKMNGKKRTRPDDDAASAVEPLAAAKPAGKVEEQTQRKKRKAKGPGAKGGS
ncbi:PHP domain-like protein [Phanerochaete sordida]|uniref:PHP domain-like protein n=1 Tax=Phanerochaete sordida TaxID=48140 RepID=A0A9P3LLY3_9APHY|nr:PHP domain-like protein [Phanerochaete sordida]